MNTQATTITLFILGFILNLIIAASRAGLLNARPQRLQAWHEKRQLNIAPTIKLLNNPALLRVLLSISQAVLRFLLIGLILYGLVSPHPTQISFLNVTLWLILAAIIITMSEQLVEAVVLQEPEAWALRLTGVTRIIFGLLSPVLALPYLVSRFIVPAAPNSSRVTEDELKYILDTSEEEGVLEQEERRMISSIFQFRDTLAREIMVPRIDILALKVDTTILEAIDAMLASGYSRVPVYEGTIDSVIGILYVKDLLQHCRDGEQSATLHDKLRSAYYVPETKKVDELLAEMQEQRIHIAVVVDEYGGVAGVVTLEDIVEELVGEIQDEYDQSEEEIYQQIGENEYLFQGRIDLHDFSEIMGSEISEEDTDTLGGLIYSKIGRVPKGGETLYANDILLTVEQVTGRRIRKVRAKKITATQNESGEAPTGDN